MFLNNGRSDQVARGLNRKRVEGCALVGSSSFSRPVHGLLGLHQLFRTLLKYTEQRVFGH